MIRPSPRVSERAPSTRSHRRNLLAAASRDIGSTIVSDPLHPETCPPSFQRVARPTRLDGQPALFSRREYTSVFAAFSFFETERQQITARKTEKPRQQQVFPVPRRGIN